jgi:hypothetical protein
MRGMLYPKGNPFSSEKTPPSLFQKGKAMIFPTMAFPTSAYGVLDSVQRNINTKMNTSMSMRMRI